MTPEQEHRTAVMIVPTAPRSDTTSPRDSAGVLQPGARLRLHLVQLIAGQVQRPVLQPVLDLLDAVADRGGQCRSLFHDRPQHQEQDHRTGHGDDQQRQHHREHLGHDPLEQSRHRTRQAVTNRARKTANATGPIWNSVRPGWAPSPTTRMRQVIPASVLSVSGTCHGGIAPAGVPVWSATEHRTRAQYGSDTPVVEVE